ncbi:formate dehydrogenase accessory sulfurtransferase FdhD [Corynebacterium pelargi]|uniref:Sulfur carrier protein FdhD n=1 Tax=Corynebacterium pelargi TaxID=1471400 RepID=A0A410WAT9_9CORY|nr:formate dehydrogenase accessory sulfurtransferase FdhD [Corynebacterium pelargi]QAU53078.1 formate dehydrogenase accessory protein [Corynebacterium pelargi]GGG75014.1 sulfurtransferase FdhD [Corynebacterium pelargi]
MGRLSRNIAVSKISLVDDPPHHERRADSIAVEEPLEVRIGGQVVASTMRTPGHDIEWLHGYLFSEGLIRSASDVAEARYCAGATADGVNTYNVLEVDLRPGVRAPGLEHIRLSPGTSACGVCGSSSMDAVLRRVPTKLSPPRLRAEQIAAMPQMLRKQQKLFRRTGGVHAAGIFNAQGELELLREDVGRHNAADKAIGALLLDDALPANDKVLVMSSRASFELVQKAALAGIPALVAVSAATSLAVDLARATGMVLAGFVRDDRLNLYAGELEY